MRDGLEGSLGLCSISMDLLLPCYPEVRDKFANEKRQGCSFDALELFVRHFLREGSVIATFGFENLYEKGILTELHFHDIQSRYRSLSEDLDLLDEAINELEEQDIMKSSRSTMSKPFRTELRAVIFQRDAGAVGKVLATDEGHVDAKTLCFAIRHYEPTVFRLLLEHGAQANGSDVLNVPLHRAAKAGHMDAVRLLLRHGANKEGNFCVSATPLTGAASAGHLEIVQYLVEKEGADINGNHYKTPLSRAVQHHHRHIVDYLLMAGAGVLKPNEARVDVSAADILDVCSPNLHLTLHPTVSTYLLSLAAKQGDLDSMKRLVNLGADVNPAKYESPLRLAARHGYLEAVRWLVTAGANVDPLNTRYRNGLVVPGYSLLAEAAQYEQVTDFLSSAGATFLGGEGNLGVTGSFSCQHARQSWLEHKWFTKRQHLIRIHAVDEDVSRFSMQERCHFKDEPDINDGECPAVTALRAQERRNMARRLSAKVATSCEKLLDAGARADVSDSLREFVGKIGTTSSVFRGGTRAIRDISEGYMPSSLSAVVSALQVANAMRSAVRSSETVCSKKA